MGIGHAATRYRFPAHSALTLPPLAVDADGNVVTADTVLAKIDLSAP